MFHFFREKHKPAGLFYSTDIHSHLVPGIDDGSRDVHTSLTLIHHMKNWGIKRILTTPHVTQDTFENTPAIISEAFSSLQKAIKENDIDIDILHSAEYRLDDYFLKTFRNNDLVLFPNNHILVENSFIQEPMHFDNTLFELKLKGYTPILAHPERYKYYSYKKNRYEEIHDTGTLFQVNILSFSGYYGKEIKDTSEWLLDNNMIDFIGTDLHNIKHAELIDEFIKTKAYHKVAEKTNIKNDTAFV